MPTDQSSYGFGPGSVTPDGCAVDVYLRLPPLGEPDIIHAAIPPGARILDLGCGTGRIASPLARLGHQVVAVDESPDMLAHVVDAVPVRGRIEDLALDRQFDVVLLASHLINTPDPRQRQAFLRACRRHLTPTGQVVAQWHPPEWFDRLSAGARHDGAIGEVLTRLDVLSSAEDLVTAEVSYRILDDVWIQRFTARRLTDEDLAEELRSADLELHGWLDPGRCWLDARPAGSVG